MQSTRETETGVVVVDDSAPQASTSGQTMARWERGVPPTRDIHETFYSTLGREGQRLRHPYPGYEQQGWLRVGRDSNGDR